MASAYERAQRDRDFLLRFALAYRGKPEPLDALLWLDRPDLPGPSGAPAPLSAEGRRALYRAAPDSGDARRRAALVASLQIDQTAAQDAVEAALGSTESPTYREAPSLPGTTGLPRSRGCVRARARGGALLLLGALLGAAVASTHHEAPQARVAPTLPTVLKAQAEVLDRVVGSPGTLAAEDYYRLYPEFLPRGWRASALVSSYRDLRGTVHLSRPLPPRSQWVMWIVTCPAGDKTYHFGFSTRTAAHLELAPGETVLGVCGTVVPQQNKVPPHATAASIHLAVDGPLPYSVTVYIR